ncbi:Fic family protein [bacterium]|nr:Fic family protein [bacterium]
MPFDPNKPYNDLPLLPPAADIETKFILKKLTAARVALSELKGRALVIPNQKMLINSLVLQEAKSSSSIENIFTTDDKLYKAFSASQPTLDPATKEVLKYRKAVWHAHQHFIPNKLFDQNLIENIYRDIKEEADGFRTIQVRIGNQHTTVYTPPEPGDILNAKISNWLDFANSANDLDPLIKMAVLHYQFESIHPFKDGNGRTGRVINVLYLVKQGLLDLPILYLSKYINQNKDRYYSLLTDVTANSNWEALIIYMLDAIENTAVSTLQKINEIYSLFDDTLKVVKKEAVDIYSYELVELLFHQPYCKISFLTDANIGNRNTASKYLNKLESLGILKKEKEGTEILYLNQKLYEILIK